MQRRYMITLTSVDKECHMDGTAAFASVSPKRTISVHRWMIVVFELELLYA